MSLLIGDDDAHDSPARINRELFAHAGWSRLGAVLAGAATVFVRTPIEYHGRVLYPVFIRHPQYSWYQPFYRSTGQSMPSASPAGTIWPILGVYTEAYCLARGIELTEAGHIGKFFHNPKHARWVSHGNDRTRGWPFLSEIVDLLSTAAEQNLGAEDGSLVGHPADEELSLEQ